MRNKLQKEVIEEFLKWATEGIEKDIKKSTLASRRTQEKAAERKWALQLICEQANMTDVLNKIRGEESL